MEGPEARSPSKPREYLEAGAKFACLDIHGTVPYWSEELDKSGYAMRMFQRYSRREDDSEAEPFEKVEAKVERFLAAATAELSKVNNPDEEEKKLALGRLYAALHYETEVRRWAARSRQVVFHEVRPASSDFGKFREQFWTPPYIKVGYWARPVVCFFFCFAAQSFMLHLATRSYIHYMDTADELLKAVPKEARNATQLQMEAVGEHDTASLFQGQLRDFVSKMMIAVFPFFRDGVPLWLLDLSGALPAFLFLVTYVVVHAKGGSNIGLWTKTFIVACLMALMKGSIDLITIVPDSAGWNKCKARLGAEDLEALRNLNFRTDFLAAAAGAMYYEIFGGAKGRMRYCADMLISGHTYFAVLFSLSAYSMIRYVTTKAPRIRYLFLGVFTFCILTEIFLVAGARFHYAVDMVLSVILVVTLWDSAHIETLASNLTLGYEWCNEDHGIKTFFMGGGHSHRGKELWEVNSEANWKKRWEENEKWFLGCPKFHVISTETNEEYCLRRRGRSDAEWEPKGQCPREGCYPVKVCASVEPWKSTKLIDLDFCQNMVLEDPDGVAARPPSQDQRLNPSEPNNSGSSSTDPLVNP